MSNPSIPAAHEQHLKLAKVPAAVHVENGKISDRRGYRESIGQVDDKYKRQNHELKRGAKQWLLDSIDKAIAVAPKALNKAGKDAIEMVNDLRAKLRKNKTKSEDIKKHSRCKKNLRFVYFLTFPMTANSNY